ncbi:Snf7-domain-containing protein [Lobosporangium transversale]|uniref:Snf7-domain-containing protein n=1 Tax=Lobosporangium transversale TaxID=64571 RepID=A0A1Y2GRY9_9FUNG|nr:Snf7-domain-containing protein [Lobosporangium transversale]ORZ20907.1 Snf7-domain-containing protein [Lobosporangium transversale]|eukprot:XP_021882816.1 Snf7-domain-containing protein [Lobosporangium transversale]
MSELALSPKTNRKLSLQTYLVSLPEWTSTTRLVSLYSEFDKLKETNPYGYEANINWWRSVILGAARNGFLSNYQSFSPVLSPRYLQQDPIASGSSSRSNPTYEATGNAIGILELDLDQLGIKFQKNGRRPSSLQAVMTEMTRLGEVVPRSEFLPWAGVGWTGWVFHKVVKAPLLWSLKQLSLSDSSSSPSFSASPTLASTGFGNSGGVSGGSNSNINIGGSASSTGMLSSSNGLGLGLTSSSSTSSIRRETYVILPFVKEAAARIIKLQQESAGYHASENLMTFTEFRQRFSRTALLPLQRKLSRDETTGAGSVLVLTDRDLEIVMRYMQFEMKVLITGKLDVSKHDNEVQEHEMVIKFATKDIIRNKSKQEITAADRGIIELRETCKRLDTQVQDIEARIIELTEKARSCVRKNQRSQAAFALRQRKNLDDVLNKRIKSLDTISSILFRIQSSETDAEVLQSYRLGASTLESVMASKDQNGRQLLSRDNVESTMDRLADVFADQEEVDQAMNEGTEVLLQSTASNGMDEDELMAELDALMEQKTTPETAKDTKNTAEALKHVNSEVLVPTSSTSPPIPASEFMPTSPSRAHSSSSIPTPGKRVAEVPEQAFVKQRKVSQSRVHSQRRDSNDHNVISTEDQPSISVTDNAGAEYVAAGSPHDIKHSEQEPSASSRMETDHAHASDSVTGQLQRPILSQVASEGLSTQEERDLDAMLSELENIKAPEEDIQMEKPLSSTENKTTGKEPLKKTNQERRVMEYS